MMAQSRWKNFEEHWDPLSDMREAGAPYSKTQCSVNSTAVDSAVIFLIGNVFVSLLKRSVITRKKRCAVYYLGRGPSRSINTDSSGELSGNN